jgi:hypothetical protein
MIAPSHFVDYTQETVTILTALTNAATKTKAKTGKKCTPGAKSLTAPYRKLTPIFDDGDGQTDMDVEMDICPASSSQSHDVKDATYNFPTLLRIKSSVIT